MSALQHRLAELVAEHGLEEGSARRLRALLAIVDADPQAPTTVTDPGVGVEVHVADALDGLRVPAVRAARRLADLGAGAGFPGLVLAIALPAAHVTLVESVGKKVAFMQRAAAAAAIDNATPLQTRAEEWAAGTAVHDVVTARALAPLTTLVEYAAPLLRLGGHLVAWKGTPDEAEEADGAAAAEATGLVLDHVIAIEPRPQAQRRHLYVYAKAGETPAAFPRRVGMARKRPITASR